MQRMPMFDRKLAAFALLALVVTLTAVAAVAHNASARNAVKPVNSASPSISGTAQEGQTLTASNGTWAGTAPITFSYQWSRCDQNGKSCAAINGATSSTFQLQRIDVDNTIIVTVTATNGDGNDSAPSAATAVVKSAASSLKPANVNPPTISGTAQEGQTLTANEGNWNTSPLNFTYQWSRCDQNGKSCAAISGSVGKSYQLQKVDVGNTVIVTVKATNNLGSDSAASDPTAVVTSGAPAPAPTGCPSGTGVMQIADVSPPARLQIDHQQITPGLVTPSTSSIQLRARVTACGGRPVQGALLYATAVPYNQYSIPPEGTTGADGTATVTMNQLTGFPVSNKQQLLVMFLRARKNGEVITAGISTRLLVSFHVSLK